MRKKTDARVPIFVFAVLVALCAGVLAIAFVEAPANSVGIGHPAFDTMRQGGDAARHDPLLPWGWLYGALSIALFAGLMAFGLRRRGRMPAGSGAALLVAAALFVLVFTLFFLSYRAYAEPDAARPLFGSFPRPSAWMLYGLWPFPLVFVWLYMRHFDRWVISADEVAAFERFVAASRGGRSAAGADEGDGGFPERSPGAERRSPERG